MKIIAALLLVTVLCAMSGEARKGKGRGGMQQSYGGSGQHSSGGSPMQHRAPMQGKSKAKGQQQPMSHGRPARPMMSSSYGVSGSTAPQQMSGSYGSAPSMVAQQQHKPSAPSSYGSANNGAMAPPKSSKGNPAPMSSSY